MSLSSDQRGSVTILMAGLFLVLTVLLLGSADVARVLGTRSRAQAAADLAALAVAQELAVPTGENPLGLAETYAAANGGRVVVCVCEAGTSEARVVIEASIGPLLLLPDLGAVDAQARAVVAGVAG